MKDKAPISTEELLGLIYKSIRGSKRNSLTAKMDRILRRIDDFINNKDSFRANSCPHRMDIEALRLTVTEHKSFHDRQNGIKDKRSDKVFKLLGVMFAALGLATSLTFSIMAYFK